MDGSERSSATRRDHLGPPVQQQSPAAKTGDESRELGGVVRSASPRMILGVQHECQRQEGT